MRGITTKVAGVALATVMMFGGMSVFAAENGDKVYSNDIRVVSPIITRHSQFTTTMDASPYHTMVFGERTQ